MANIHMFDGAVRGFVGRCCGRHTWWGGKKSEEKEGLSSPVFKVGRLPCCHPSSCFWKKKKIEFKTLIRLLVDLIVYCPVRRIYMQARGENFRSDDWTIVSKLNADSRPPIKTDREWLTPPTSISTMSQVETVTLGPLVVPRIFNGLWQLSSQGMPVLFLQSSLLDYLNISSMGFGTHRQDKTRNEALHGIGIDCIR